MIVVTGAATGRPGVPRRGTPVRALVRDWNSAAGLAALPGVELAVGDMLWPETLEPALDGVDRVLMISGAGSRMLETQATFIDAAACAGATVRPASTCPHHRFGVEPTTFAAFAAREAAAFRAEHQRTPV
jgi:uncharacterized protein YbjT (DUF2867 family)